jgi:peptidyl-prolyl cis-trans isomerase SurA
MAATAGTAHATVVEKVVAVVGEHAILLSELRQRARPVLLQIHARVPPGAEQTKLKNQFMREVLERMIDDRLEKQAAEKHRITVTSEEIDAATERLAKMQRLSVDQLLSEAVRTGLTVQEYRDELRRQLLEGKLMDLRVKGRVRVTEEEMRALYARVTREERHQLGYRAQWIVLRVPPGASAAVRTQRRTAAERLAAEARAGADFGALARSHSDDAPTKTAGGDLGHQKPGQLDDPIEQVALSLEVGQVSAPFAYADAIVVLRLADRDPSRYGSYEDLKDLLAQRVYAEQMEKAKRKWLDGLKRGMHIDTRL